VQLSLLPFVSLRDFHGERRAGGTNFDVRAAGRTCAVADGDHDLHVWADAGRLVRRDDWWYGHVYQIEAARGLGHVEDLYQPGRFTLETDKATTVTLWAELGPRREMPAPEAPPGGYDFDAELSRRRRVVAAASKLPGVANPSEIVRRLARSANDFVVARKAPDGTAGSTVVAGYPWFADWGRDTMISLPGLFLVTGRFAEAKQVLGVFASYVSEGMIPNRFNDYTNEPEYNTVDASLWFIHAAHEYARLSKDVATFEQILLPACRKIIEGYRKGTRYHIAMDPADGSSPRATPTRSSRGWTPSATASRSRRGRARPSRSTRCGTTRCADGRARLAAKVQESFRKAFWISPFRGLADVVGRRPPRRGRPPEPDLRRQPAQQPADRRAAGRGRRGRAARAADARRPAHAGPSDPNFKPHYGGRQVQRDAAYHNGTIWPWPLGAFLEAYLKVNKRSPASIEQAKRWLEPLIAHLEHDACVGSISEIFEAENPTAPTAARRRRGALPRPCGWPWRWGCSRPWPRAERSRSAHRLVLLGIL
jgi:glycogen debranching enzyme